MSGHHIINLFISCFDWFGGLENLLRFYLTPRSGPVPEDEFACLIIVYSPFWLNWKSCSTSCIISEECFSSMVCKLCSQTRDIIHQHFCPLMFECEVKNKYISVSIYKTSFKFKPSFIIALVNSTKLCMLYIMMSFEVNMLKKQHEHNSKTVFF